MTRRHNPELTRRRAFSDPAVEDTGGNELLARDPNALAVERARPQAAQPQRIVDDRDAAAEHRCAELLLQEAGLSRDRRPRNRAGEMAEQARRHTRVEQHRITARPGASWVEAGDRPFTGFAPGLGSGIEVGEMARA